MVGVDGSFSGPNEFAAVVVYALPMVYPVSILVRNHWQRLFLLGYVGLSALCVWLTGSRSAFAGLLVLACLAGVASKYRVRLAVLACVLVPIIWGSLREDMRNRYMTLVDPSYGSAGAQASAEGRTKHFFEGIELWKQHPVTGVGPSMSGRARGTKQLLFNLYGETLAELGTLGALSLLLAIGGIVANAIEMLRLTRSSRAEAAFLRRVSTAVVLSFFLLLFLGWGHGNLYHYTWLWFGAFQAIALHCVKQAAAEPEPNPAMVAPGSLPMPVSIQFTQAGQNVASAMAIPRQPIAPSRLRIDSPERPLE